MFFAVSAGVPGRCTAGQPGGRDATWVTALPRILQTGSISYCWHVL